jgi:hypothetical protein
VLRVYVYAHKDPVEVGPVKRSLVVWIFRVSPGVVPRSLVGSDGMLQARKIGDDEDPTAYFFNVGSLWAVRFEDVPLQIRGGS